MDAAISNLSSLSDHKKVAVLGDMFELGDDSMLEHQKIVDQLSAIGLFAVYLVGETFYQTNALHSNIHKFKSFEEFVKLFEGNSYTETTFLIKASRGMALERTLDYI